MNEEKKSVENRPRTRPNEGHSMRWGVEEDDRSQDEPVPENPNAKTRLAKTGLIN